MISTSLYWLVNVHIQGDLTTNSQLSCIHSITAQPAALTFHGLKCPPTASPVQGNSSMGCTGISWMWKPLASPLRPCSSMRLGDINKPVSCVKTTSPVCDRHGSVLDELQSSLQRWRHAVPKPLSRHRLDKEQRAVWSKKGHFGHSLVSMASRSLSSPYSMTLSSCN